MPVSLPRSIIDPLIEFAKLSDQDFDSLKKGLASIAVSVSPKDVAKQLIPFLSQTSERDLHRIVSSLVSVITTQWANHIEPSQAAADIADALTGRGLSESLRNQFQARLQTILELDAGIRVAAKAMSLLVDHNKVFREAQIFTDVRPVFTDAKPTALAGAVIIHTLKIEYGEADEDRSVYLALDTADISKLRRVLDRADEKATSLKEFLHRGNLQYVEVPEDA